ncbi:hypothetical protein D3C84_1105220 [compost metagenome]
MDPVVVAGQPGELVDHGLIDDELVAPGGELVADQSLQGLGVVDADLSARGLRLDLLNDFRRLETARGHLFVQPGEAQQRVAGSVDGVEHRL